MGHQGNDAKDLRKELNGLRRRRIQEVRSVLWRRVQEQEEEIAFQEEEMILSIHRQIIEIHLITLSAITIYLPYDD